MWVMFSDNTNIKVGNNILLDNFGSHNIVFLLFPSLSNYSRINIRPIDYISDLFFFKYDLGKIGPLKPIFKATELFFLTLVIVIFIYYLKEV